MFNRITDLLAAKTNAVMDKIETPEAMLPQYVKKLEKQHEAVKQETASIAGSTKGIKRAMDSLDKEIEKRDADARKAVLAGNEEDAKRFLADKNKLIEKKNQYAATYATQSDSVGRMLELGDKLEDDITDLKERQEIVLGNKKAADNQVKVEKIVGKINSANGYKSKFEAKEKKLFNKIDTAAALTAINVAREQDSIENLTRKYDRQFFSDSVEHELDAIKAELGVSKHAAVAE